MLSVRCVLQFFNPGRPHLKAHDSWREHQQHVSGVSSRASVFQTSGLRKQQRHSEELTYAELELLTWAAAAICHCWFASIDHFSEVIMKNGAGSNLETLILHSTECFMLCFLLLRRIYEKVNHAKCCCLLVNEATDVFSEKSLCVCFRLCDGNICQVVTAT